MTEKKPQGVESAHTTVRSAEVKVGKPTASTSITSVTSAEIKMPEPTVQSKHTTIVEDPVQEAKKKPNDPDEAAKDGQA